MNDNDQIDALIRKHFACAGVVSTLQDTTSLRADLFGTDLDVISLVMEIEDIHNLEISDEEDENLRTVGDVRRLVASKLAVRA